MPPLGTASVSALRQYVRYADAKGIDTTHLFSKAGLELNILDTGDGRLNGEQFQIFIRLLAETTGNPFSAWKPVITCSQAPIACLVT